MYVLYNTKETVYLAKAVVKDYVQYEKREALERKGMS